MYENLTTELFIIQNHFFFQLPPIKELGDAAFNFVFEGSDMLAKVTEGLDPETCEYWWGLMAVSIDEAFGSMPWQDQLYEMILFS